MIAWLAIEKRGANLEALGHYLNRDASTLCKAVNNITLWKQESNAFKRRLNTLNNALMQA